MIRYIRQRQVTTCGPVVVINAMKWAGIPVTEKKDLPLIKKKCRWKLKGSSNDFIPQRSGTTITGVCNALRDIDKIKIGTIMPASVETIESQLNKNYAVIIQWFNENGTSHFVLCPGKTKKGNFIIINATHDKTVIRMPRRQLRKRLSVITESVFGISNSVVLSFKKV